MRNLIVRLWKGEAEHVRLLLVVPLTLLSWIYGACLKLRDYMYKSGTLKVQEVPIPVISVGNISLGGTGKTPVVERISVLLKERGFHPGIVTRGYKRRKKGIFAVDASTDSAKMVGDEAFMLARRTGLPVIVGSDRALAIVEGMKNFRIDIALLDDGFQVRNLRKDAEVVVLNPGHGKLFPLGSDREPPAKLRNATIVLANKGDLDDMVRGVIPGIPVFTMRYKPVYLHNIKRNLIGHYGFLRGKRIAAFSGLGDNASFFSLLEDLGAQVVEELEFPDHHAYTARDMEKIRALNHVDALVTTEKDAVKLMDRDLPENLFYLTIEAQIEGEAEMLELLLTKLRKTYGCIPKGPACLMADA